jgi:transposase-like protein
MKRPKGPLRRRRRISAKQRAKLLAAFKRGGISGKAFARKHGIGYSTLHAWRRERRNGRSSPGFVQVELSESKVPTEVVIELGIAARLRLHSVDQLELVASLIQRLNVAPSC